jgi:hypothetical protein
MTSLASQLWAIAQAARRFIAPHWREWHGQGGFGQPEIAPANTCGRTSLFLVQVLRQEALPAQWRTGVPRPSEKGLELGPFGFRVGDRWQGHSWVQSGDWIVDITADQFGAEPVIVTPANDPRYGIGPVDPADPVHIANRQRTVDQIWPDWLDHRARHRA